MSFAPRLVMFAREEASVERWVGSAAKAARSARRMAGEEAMWP
jgi:hypothetical protein